jgi:peptide/nickel transport system substrate-binding protein
MMTKLSWSRMMFFMMLIFVLALAACGGGGDSSDEESDSADEGSDDGGGEETADGGEVYDYEDFPDTVTNEAEPTGEGTVKIGYASDTPFEGTLNWAFYNGNPDSVMLSYFDESVFTVDEDLQYTNDGAMTFEVDEDNNQVTFTLNEDVTWHDGEPATIDDYVASYEVIGHPDYDGVRAEDDGFTLIEGYDEYHSGDADEISGIEVIDDHTATFTYTELSPSLTAGGFWSYLFPEHYYEGVDIADMSSASQTREEPIGIGPYKVDSITPGESIVYSKNEDYWRGEPQLDGLEVQVIAPSSIANAVETGEVHYVESFPTDQFPDIGEIDGVEWLGSLEGSYTYIGFKLGEWNADENQVDYKPDEMKMGDKELRRAMWHAIDNDAIGERFYNGLRWKATSLITPYHASWHNDEVEVPDYDPDEANRILDEAGYEDVDGDGLREDPDGEPLEINFASMSGGDTAEPLANYYIQSWKEVGLNVQLTNGRLIEFNTFYDMVENDDPEIDIYQAAWSLGTDVDPGNLYGEKASFNYARYATEENTELINQGVSAEAFDVDYRMDIYNQWQELMVEEMPVIPTLYRAEMTPVSEDIVNYTKKVEYIEGYELYNLGLSE